MSVPQRTTLPIVIQAIQAQLMAGLNWPAERVLITDPDYLPGPPMGNQFLMLWPERQIPDSPIDTGAGRNFFAVRRNMFVELRTRMELDETHSRQIWLTNPATNSSTDNPTLGHAVVEHTLFDLLIQMELVDSTGNWLLMEEAKAGEAGPPGIDRKLKEWGQSVLPFSVKFALDLTLLRQ